MKIFSSAKINLNLMINNEIIDGLHTLSTLMVPINLFDEIEIHEIENTEDVIEFATEIEIDGESTIHKAMKALRRVNNFEKKFHIKILKNIPTEAGLGGGSSNAGSVLKYMSNKYNLAIPGMSTIAKDIGSDVPFFVKGQSAKVEGFGEEVNSIEIVEPQHFIIATPYETLSTKKVFESFDKLERRIKIDTDFYKGVEIRNNLWQAAVNVEPKLLEHKEYLEKTTDKEFYMSGSGTTLFCCGEEQQLLKNLDAIEKDRFRMVTTTKKIDCSLLQEAD